MSHKLKNLSDIATSNDIMTLAALLDEATETFKSNNPIKDFLLVDTTSNATNTMAVFSHFTPIAITTTEPTQAATINTPSVTTTEITALALTVSTDKPDYSPGQMATFTAANIPVGDAVNFSVAHVTAGNDGIMGTADDVLLHDISGTTQSWTVTDGGVGDLDGVANGKIVTSWQVHQDALNQAFQLTATAVVAGGSQTQTAATNFTDSGPSYIYTTIDDPASYSFGNTTGYTWATGINDAGQVVGYFVYGLDPSHMYGFVDTGGTFETIFTWEHGLRLFGINNVGQYVGNINSYDGHGYGFTTGLEGHSERGINDAGQIVGDYAVGNYWSGYLYSGGTYTTINDPLATSRTDVGGLGTHATGINDDGVVVGYYYDDSLVAHGFTYTGGAYSTLDDPLGAYGTVLTGINNNGVIVGHYDDGSHTYGFLYSDGQFTTLTDALAASATGINDEGQLVGSFQDSTGNHGFLATPSTNDPTIQRVSVASDGTQADGESALPVISGNGRYVAFTSLADNLVSGDTNGVEDVFVKDLTTGGIIRVSTDSTGGQSNGNSLLSVISADGRYVAFYSAASNLIAGGTSGVGDIFVKDTLTGVTTQVSTSSNGAPGNGKSYAPAISADGHYVAFESNASNLIAGGSSGGREVFVKDLWTGTTTLVSTDPSGAQVTGQSPSVSNDGHVVFLTGATIYMTDLSTGSTTYVGSGFGPHISADGKYVAFNSGPYGNDILVYSMATGTTTLASTDSNGVSGNGASVYPSISADGHYVVFYSVASNLVPGDANAAGDVFVKDLVTGTTSIVSANFGTQGSDFGGGSGWPPAISDDGRYVAFWSPASNLVPGDTNGTYDIFVADLLGGNNQPPTIDLAHSSITGTLSELPLTTASNTLDHTAGVIAFADPDLTDRPTATLTNQTAVYHDAHGNTVALSVAQIAAFESAFSITPEAGNTNTGKIDWSYSITDKALDFLGFGENAIVTSTIQVDDGHGGTADQSVTITINGATDLVANPDFTTVQKGGTTTGNVLANDVDVDIHHALQVSAVNADPTKVGIAYHGTYGDLTLNADGSYTYVETKPLGSAASSGAFDVFNYTVDDGHGGTAISTLTVTIDSHGSTSFGGSLVNDLNLAETEIAAQVQKGIPLSKAFYLNDSTLVAAIAADVAAEFNSHFTIDNQGYIFETGYPDTKQCVALVLGLDNNLPLHTNPPPAQGQTTWWTNGSEQIDLNGGLNPAITPGTAVPIATFVDSAGHQVANLAPGAGEYPTTGDLHAAFFLGYGTEGGSLGFFVLDQYVNQPNLHPASQPAEVRFYPFTNQLADEYYNIVATGVHSSLST